MKYYDSNFHDEPRKMVEDTPRKRKISLLSVLGGNATTLEKRGDLHIKVIQGFMDNFNVNSKTGYQSEKTVQSIDSLLDLLESDNFQQLVDRFDINVYSNGIVLRLPGCKDLSIELLEPTTFNKEMNLHNTVVENGFGHLLLDILYVDFGRDKNITYENYSNHKAFKTVRGIRIKADRNYSFYKDTSNIWKLEEMLSKEDIEIIRSFKLSCPELNVNYKWLLDLIYENNLMSSISTYDYLTDFNRTLNEIEYAWHPNPRFAYYMGRPVLLGTN